MGCLLVCRELLNCTDLVFTGPLGSCEYFIWPLLRRKRFPSKLEERIKLAAEFLILNFRCPCVPTRFLLRKPLIIAHEHFPLMLFLSPPPRGWDWIQLLTDRVPSNRRLQSPPGRTGSLARGSYNFRKRSLRRSRCEHGGVGFGRF